MKTMFVVWGPSNRGKSQCIRLLVKSFKDLEIIKAWNDDEYDSYIIAKYRDKAKNQRIIGIENLGDPAYCEKQDEWITDCIKHDCEVIVAASRSYGETYNNALRLAKENNYEVVELTTMYNVRGNDSIMTNGLDLKEVWVNSMRELIDKCLD